MVPRPTFKFGLASLALVPFAALWLHAQGFQRDNKPSETGAMPPKTWVDKDTGHRVIRVSDEPNSGAFYFNVKWSTTRRTAFVCSTWRP